MIRVVLPFHLRTLARIDGDDIRLEITAPATLGSVLDALELRYPVLRGAIREQVTLRRRPFVRFYACKEDLSHEPPETPLPPSVVAGAEPFFVIGAMAGG
jgi:molybdopterin synthase sulfur carrier subunit